MNNLIGNKPLNIDCFYKYNHHQDIIQIYGDPSLSMRDGVGEGTMSEEQTNIKTMSITQLSINNIYPNPVYDDKLIMDIISVSDMNNVKIMVYDISGRLVKSDIINLTSGINKISIDTTMLSSGVYILEVSNNELSVSDKFIKVR